MALSLVVYTADVLASNLSFFSEVQCLFPKAYSHSLVVSVLFKVLFVINVNLRWRHLCLAIPTSRFLSLNTVRGGRRTCL
jgi:hypothetical protein